MQPSVKRRLLRLLRFYGLLLLVGGLYALVCTTFGFWIPCPFRALTGYLCPGCGVSHLCLSLLRLDFRGAWAANPAICVLLPFGAVLAVRLSVRYVKAGTLRATRAESACLYAACAALVVFGIVRNL